MYIDVSQVIKATPQKVQAVLLEHEQLGRFFNATFRIKTPSPDGEVSGGVGTIRTVSIGPLSFDEKIVEASNSTIVYQVIGNAPVKNHKGRIELRNVNQYCEINYTISFQSNTWLPGSILRWFVKRDIQSAMTKLAAHFDAQYCNR